MPWTRKMKSGPHADPSMGHEKKGQFHKDSAKYTGSASSYKHSRPVRKVVKRSFNA